MECYDKFAKDIGIINGLVTSLGIDNDIFKSVIKMFDYPSIIINLIIEDPILILNILNFYKRHLDNSIENETDFMIMREEIKNKILNGSSETKIKYNRFHNILFEHLNTIEWFKNYYESVEGNIILPELDLGLDESIVATMSEFAWRENQLAQINLKNEYGIQSGIHCQATGTGKSYLIINDIDYIWRHVNNKCKIILFTERINILKDLFGFIRDHDNINVLDMWKEKGIGDLTQFLIINRVTEKTYDWVDILNNHDGPALVVINRAFLTSAKSKHQEIKNLDAIIFDECHSSTSPKCHDFLIHWKERNTAIIGYSATPLRAGKTQGQFNKELLLEIFACPNDKTKLNLLTNFNMLYSIKNKLILPPKFIWYEIQECENNKNEIHESDYVAVLSVLNKVMEIVQNGKIIAWCGTINMSEEWYKIFDRMKGNHNDLKSIKTYIDHSKKSEDYNLFKTLTNDAIMFCAQKHREGSDISKLDVAIFLDKVKNRSAIVFIQSIGRVLRLDPDNIEKEYGVVVEGIYKNSKNYDKEFIDKILGYYFALENMSDVEGEDCYEKYGKIMDMIKFDKTTKTINLDFGEIVIPIKYDTLDWKNIIKNFQHIIQNKVKLSPEQMFNMYVEKLKKIRVFQNSNSDFRDEYKKLDHDKLGLPVDIYEDYKEIFESKTWYDILGHTNVFHTLDEIQEIVYGEYPGIKNLTKKEYTALKSKYGLVPYPFEYFRLQKIGKYSQLL
jgi:superfamily II DNA or RNA helicase